MDVYGWSFDFVSRGLVKYASKFTGTAKRWNEVNRTDRKYGITLALNASVWDAIGDRRKWLRGKKYVGVPTDSPDIRVKEQIRRFDGVACNNLVAYRKLKEEFPRATNIFYTPNGIDTQVFNPRPEWVVPGRFNVGWVGTVSWNLKRVQIATKLKYPVKIRSKRYGKYFRKGISRQSMIDFYRSIDCLIITSDHEGMPNVVLEAAACGLPIVSTPVGDIPKLINKKWLVPVNPPKLCLREMNRKLDLLKRNVTLRETVGRRNRKQVVKKWSWKRQVKNYERMFEG